ncbi:MAG: low-specificity L-threonine aldolase [Dehalococcoidales bacterium]
MKIIDLRSDTVTHPTDAMRQAMSAAAVGDDVFGEDPTVNRLETMAAQKMGKEAALFTVSGTMSNLVAVLTHTQHGNEIILGTEAHIFLNEVGGAAALGGVMVHTVANDAAGRLPLADIENAVRDKNIHYPETTLLCLENTQNRCGGVVLAPDYTQQAAALAHRHGLKVHLDGARVFNAAVALGIPAVELTKEVDSVGFCLSKGLSAPVGSVLCGSREFIERARKKRKMLGGGMRQAGIIAAAGIVALETMVDRLAEDHSNARKLAAGLAQIRGIALAQAKVDTNIVIFDLSPSLPVNQFISKLNSSGVKISRFGTYRFRAVTHRMVDTADIDSALDRMEKVCRELRPV